MASVVVAFSVYRSNHCDIHKASLHKENHRMGNKKGWGARTLRVGVVATLAGMLFAAPHMNASAKNAQASPPYTIGVSNNLINNGWRDEMVCSIKAQAAASGAVKSGGVYVLQNQLNTAEQIAQMRQLIAKRVNAIIVDPNTVTALNGVIQQAIGRGIVVVVVDQIIQSSAPYQVANNQVAYGRIGMRWLVNRLHGHGNIAILNGIKGASADSDRITGQNGVLRQHPGIHVVARVWTNWDYPTASKAMLDILNSGKRIDGVWTSGIGYSVVTAYQTAHKPFVPVVDADNNGFVHQLLTLKGQGLVGAVVTNPPPVGGAGAAVALRVLRGQSQPKIQLLQPALWTNTNAAGIAQLRAHSLPTKPPTYGASWNVPGFTTYSKHQLLNCG
jgi:ribose transport system substrate-binding protein